MHQLLLSGLSRLLVQPTNLLPAGMKIAAYNVHRRLLVPSQGSWPSNHRIPGSESEPSLLSNQSVSPEAEQMGPLSGPPNPKTQKRPSLYGVHRDQTEAKAHLRAARMEHPQRHPQRL